MDTEETLENAITLEQDKIAVIQTRIRGLHSRQNALRSLCRLPDEILLYIMEILASSDRDDPMLYPLSSISRTTSGKKTSTACEWPRIMGVCTRTRHLALRNVHMWRHVNLNAHDSWVELCLERLRTSPFTISFNEHRVEDYDDRHRLSFQQLFRHNIPQATTIELWMFCRDELALDIDDMLCLESLPHLRSLTYITEEFVEEVDEEEAARARRFLRGASALTQLILSGFTFSAGGLHLPSLVRLELNVLMVEGPDVLISFLKEASHLQHLYLDIRYEGTQATLPIAPIHLPHLRTLYIKTSFSLCLAHLCALPDPSEELRVHVPLGEDEDPVESLDWQNDLADHVFKLLNTEHCKPSGTVEKHQYSDSVCLSLSHPGTRVGRVHYHTHDSLDNLRSALNRLHSLDITATQNGSLSDLFQQAAADLNHDLSSVESVALGDACIQSVRAALETWLRARAAAGRRLRTVTLRGCDKCKWNGTCPGGARGAEALDSAAARIREEGGAGDVVVEIKARTSPENATTFGLSRVAGPNEMGVPLSMSMLDGELIQIPESVLTGLRQELGINYDAASLTLDDKFKIFHHARMRLGMLPSMYAQPLPPLPPGVPMPTHGHSGGLLDAAPSPAQILTDAASASAPAAPVNFGAGGFGHDLMNVVATALEDPNDFDIGLFASGRNESGDLFEQQFADWFGDSGGQMIAMPEDELGMK